MCIPSPWICNWFSLVFINFYSFPLMFHGFNTSVSPESSGEVWGGLGSSREVWGGLGSSGQVRGGLGSSGQVRGGLGSSGEVRGGLGRSGEVWGAPQTSPDLWSWAAQPSNSHPKTRTSRKSIFFCCQNDVNYNEFCETDCFFLFFLTRKIRKSKQKWARNV